MSSFEFQLPSYCSMSFHPSMHLWRFSSSSLPCWRSTPVATYLLHPSCVVCITSSSSYLLSSPPSAVTPSSSPCIHHCLIPPSPIHPSSRAQKFPCILHNGDNLRCRETYRPPVCLNRQAVVLGVKGKPSRKMLHSSVFLLLDCVTLLSKDKCLSQTKVGKCILSLFPLCFGALQRWGMEWAVPRSFTWTMAMTTTPTRPSTSDWDLACVNLLKCDGDISWFRVKFVLLRCHTTTNRLMGKQLCV